MSESIIHLGRPGLGNQGRPISETEWKYFPVSLWVNAAGVASLDPLIGAQRIPRLYLVQISAFHSGEAVAGSDTILEVAYHDGGVPPQLGTLTIPTAVASYTEVTSTFQAPVTDSNNLIIFAVKTDGGHRQIFATAWFAQVPLRG